MAEPKQPAREHAVDPRSLDHKWRQLGLRLEPGWIYFVDAAGDVARTRLAGSRIQRAQRVLELGLEQEPGFLYVIDREGDVARIPLAC